MFEQEPPAQAGGSLCQTARGNQIARCSVPNRLHFELAVK
jgi:hypothetical protein